MSHVRASQAAETFIRRWRGSAGAERGNYQIFLSELCDLLGVPRPDAATGGAGDYRFERAVTHRFPDGASTTCWIDLYRRGRFVLEAKQGTAPPQPSLFGDTERQRRANVRRSPGWAKHMLQARGQAESYTRYLPAEEGYPPFLIVCDVGFCFDLYADFSGTGKHYAQFPDRERFRIYNRRAGRPRAPRDAARDLGGSAQPRPRAQAGARDARHRRPPRPPRRRAGGQGAPAARRRHVPDALRLLHVRPVGRAAANGKLHRAIGGVASQPADQLHRQPRRPLAQHGQGRLLRHAARDGEAVQRRPVPRRAGAAADRRRHARPADPGVPPRLGECRAGDLRHPARKRAGHARERAVGRSLHAARVRRTPGAADSDGAVAPRLGRGEGGGGDTRGVRPGGRGGTGAGVPRELVPSPRARPGLRQRQLPLCHAGADEAAGGRGAGPARRHRPGEGDRLAFSGASVDPHQFLGLEKNSRAVPVAELVLWIGYLQWYFRTHGNAPPAEPILRDFRNIQQADALLAYTDEKPERDKAGKLVSRWDGRTFRTHPVTGEKVPDETARELVLRPMNATPAPWPEADFIVGNPPFIAGKDMRAELGEGYAKALWAVYKDVPRSADIALFFWWKAAALTRSSMNGAPRRFGFITSNSVRQTFCRRVVAEALQGPRRLRLAFAIPDHPWADGKGAAVRIAMTVAERALDRSRPGRLVTVVAERAGKEDAPEVELSEAEGVINADLTIGAPVVEAEPLRANEGLCSRGMALYGAGFIVSPATARALSLGRVPGLEKHVRPYLNGRDLTQRSRGQMVIDLFGLTEDDVRRRFPEVWQLVRNTVWVHRNAIADTTKDVH